MNKTLKIRKLKEILASQVSTHIYHPYHHSSSKIQNHTVYALNTRHFVSEVTLGEANTNLHNVSANFCVYWVLLCLLLTWLSMCGRGQVTVQLWTYLFYRSWLSFIHFTKRKSVNYSTNTILINPKK